MTIAYEDILFFLHCGFSPKIKDNALTDFFCDDINNLKEDVFSNSSNEKELINKGINFFESGFQDIYKGMQIVPLSGGLDSRAILGALLKKGLKDNIITICFGKPGSYDFEFANLIAEKIGLNHKKLDLERIQINEKSLIDTAKNGASWTFLFDAYYNSLISKKFGRKCTYWSGFVGDVIAGSHIPRVESSSWEEAKNYFIKKNRISHHYKFSPNGFSLDNCLPQSPLLNKAILSYDDQLDFALRQENYTRKVNLFSDYNYKTPFLNESWVKFMFTIPRKFRVNRYIYKKILMNGYPSLFSFPTTMNFGSSLNNSKLKFNIRRILNGSRVLLNEKSMFLSRITNPFFRFMNIWQDVNYLDFNKAIIEREDYKSIVQNNILDLKERKLLNFDIEKIYCDHINKKHHHGHLLILLTALEISLKASNQ